MEKYDNDGITRRIDEIRRKEALSMNAFAQKCEVAQGNLSKARNGKLNYSEKVLMKIARAMNVSFDWLSTGCGMCGTDGDTALKELGRDFLERRGGTNVVGDNNNVNSNVYGKVNDGNNKSAIDLFSENASGLIPTEQPSEIFKRMLKMEGEIETLRKENEMKDVRIAQLEKDKAFYQTLLQKG